MWNKIISKCIFFLFLFYLFCFQCVFWYNWTWSVIKLIVRFKLIFWKSWIQCMYWGIYITGYCWFSFHCVYIQQTTMATPLNGPYKTLLVSILRFVFSIFKTFSPHKLTTNMLFMNQCSIFMIIGLITWQYLLNLKTIFLKPLEAFCMNWTEWTEFNSKVIKVVCWFPSHICSIGGDLLCWF